MEEMSAAERGGKLRTTTDLPEGTMPSPHSPLLVTCHTSHVTFFPPEAV